MGINRLGKNLFVQLEGEWKAVGQVHDSYLVQYATPLWHIHLSSTGWILPFNEEAKAAGRVDPIHANFLHSVNAENIRLKIHFEDGQVWSYHDSRTWGRWQILEGSEWDPRGYEPYNQYGPDVLLEPKRAMEVLAGLSGSRRTIKDILTDQYVVAGLGNYLACEITHRAGIYPLRPWDSLKELDRRMLGIQMDLVLRDSLTHNDHSYWRVFKRMGRKCGSCGMAEIKYVKDSPSANRGSYYCPVCQGEV